MDAEKEPIEELETIEAEVLMALRGGHGGGTSDVPTDGRIPTCAGPRR